MLTADQAARRSRRSNWPVRLFGLGTEPGPDLTDSTTAAERVGMMWQLTCEGWAVSGRKLPTYGRADTPVALRGPELDNPASQTG